MKWDSEKIYFDNDDFYRDLIAEMEQATRFIEMEVFTFEEGLLANRLLEVFRRGIARGVLVRLVCDGWGSPRMDDGLLDQLLKMGVRVRIYRPLPWRWPRRSGGESHNRFLRFFLRLRRLNRGFHRKVTLIDRKAAWIGSLNVSDVHLKEIYGKNAWADIGGRFVGPELSELIKAFEKSFFSTRWYRNRIRPSTTVVLLNDSWFRRRRMTFLQKRRLRRTTEKIWIQNPYFVPEGSLLRALYRQAKRGVDVCILLPEKSDQPLIRWMSFVLIEQMVKHKIRVFEYLPRFSHKKILITDGHVTIGSNNFNHRSFLHDLEIEVFITQHENRLSIEKSFLSDRSESREITTQTLEKHGILFRLVARILFFFRYWC